MPRRQRAREVIAHESKTAIPAGFLAVDLDVKSTGDLGPLIDSLERRGLSPQSGKWGRKHWVHFCPLSASPDPGRAILALCRLIRQLRGNAKAAWDTASDKEFDIGIQAGYENRAGEWVLDSKVIAATRETGASIRITVYPPLMLMEERDRGAVDERGAIRTAKRKTSHREH